MIMPARLGIIEFAGELRCGVACQDCGDVALVS
jgi:hypothetical protein